MGFGVFNYDTPNNFNVYIKTEVSRKRSIQYFSVGAGLKRY
jgi:hypothetical protein